MASQVYLIALVGGYEYHPDAHNDWAVPCRSRELYLTKLFSQRPLLVITIDVARGTVREALYASRSGAPKVDTKRVKQPVTSKNYRMLEDGDNVFASGFRDAISALDIYSITIEYVAKFKAKILEFSVFSHAYSDGPILLNTWENQRVERSGGRYILVPLPSTGSLARDQDDMDPRKIDFLENSGQPTKQLLAWKTAFAEHGRSWIWGCSSNPPYRRLMLALGRLGPKLNASTRDDVEFSVALSNDDFEAVKRLSSTLLRKAKGPGKYTLLMADLRSFITTRFQDTYAQALANATSRPVFAAAYGTAAGFRNRSDMYVALSDVVPIYQRVFGKITDPEGWNYVRYDSRAMHVR